MTRSKVKDVHDSMKNKLLTMMKAWEQSGNGAGQRDVSFGDDGWGHFDPETMDGDDRAQFLRNPNEYYLLYFWHCIDEEGVIAQTLSQLPQSMEASTDNFAIVSERDSKKDRRQIANSISKIADAVADGAASIKVRVRATLQDQLERLEEELSDLEDNADNARIRRRLLKKKARIEKDLA